MKTIGCVKTAKPKRMLEDGLFAATHWHFPSRAWVVVPFVCLLRNEASTVAEDGCIDVVDIDVGDGGLLGHRGETR